MKASASKTKGKSRGPAPQAGGRKKPAPAQVNLYEAKTQLSSLVERAANGEEIIIAKAGQPKARIVPIAQPADKKPRRTFGQNFLGITYMAPDWDAPMTEEELADWGA